MAPQVGDVVFVSEHNEYDNTNTVSPALVTHVYSDADGDAQWWNAAQEKEIVDATVFGRGGRVIAGTYGKSEEVTVDDGQGGTITYPVGYATTPDGHGDVTTQPTTAPTTTATTPTPQAVAQTQGLSDADITRLAAALRAGNDEPTQTVGDGADVNTPTGGDTTPPAVPGGFPA